MRYFVGIDSGQTCTTAVIADDTGSLLGMGHTASIGAIREPADAERGRRLVSEALITATKMANLANAQFSVACLGIQGNQEVLESFLEPFIPVQHLIFSVGRRLSLYSVTMGKPGIVVSAGSESYAFGRNEAGLEASTGGWGLPAGDEGSSTWIGQHALGVICHAADKREDAGRLLPALLTHFEATDLPHLLRLTLESGRVRADMMAIAEVVSKEAAAGDAAAARLLRGAGTELAVMAIALINRLEISGSGVVVGTTGDVFRAGRTVLHAFRARLKKAVPGAIIVAPRLPASVSAALIAMEFLNITPDEALTERLQSSMLKLGTVKY